MSGNKRLVGSIVSLAAVAGLFLVINQKTPAPAGQPAEENKVHYSIYSQKDFFEKAFTAAPALAKSSTTGNILGILFNHHLLAPHFIAQAFNAVESDGPLTVVLLGPNHFGVGSGPILTSRESWQTPYGVLSSDIELVDSLIVSGLVKADEGPFENEHGIRNIVAFIKHSLPEAKVVPLIIKDNLPSQTADALAQFLADLPVDVLLAGSFDFSHYHDLETANLHDEKSLAVVKNLSWADTLDLDTDSGPGLRVFLEALSLRRALNFTLLEHSNSAIVARQLESTSTTSYITGYFSR